MAELDLTYADLLEHLFESHDCIEISQIRHSEQRRRSYCLERDEILGCESYLEVCREELNTEDHSVYFGPAPRRSDQLSGYGGVGVDDDVDFSRCVWMDFDDVAVREFDALRVRVQRAGLPDPTAWVFTGGGYQAFCRLTTPIARDDVRATIDAMVQAVSKVEGPGKVDSKVKNPSRVMRHPDTVNRKPERNGAVAKVVHLDQEARIDPSRLPRILPPVDRPKGENGSRIAQGAVSRRTARFIAEGAIDGDRNNELFIAACDALGNGWSIDRVRKTIGQAAINSGLSAAEVEGTIGSAARQPRTPNRATGASLIVPDNQPLVLAKSIVNQLYRDDLGGLLIRRWRGDHWIHTLGRFGYVRLDADVFKRRIWSILDRAETVTVNAKGEEKRSWLRVTEPMVNQTLSAIGAVDFAATTIPEDATAPRWLDDRSTPDPSELLICPNVVIHVPTGVEIQPCPMLFAPNVLGFDYDAEATAPEWLRFLEEMLPEPDKRDLLHEFMGCCLVSDTRLHKAVLFVGPRRGGKSTVARCLRRLVGDWNCAAPNLSDLAGDFGLEPLLGKTLAVVGDLRLGRASRHAVAVSRILEITGEDAISVNRKHKPILTEAKMPVRFLLISNELPRMQDSSGTIADRFMILRFDQSVSGREDPNLFEKLEKEMPGIANLAMAGYRRLLDRGRFTVPESSAEYAQEFHRLTSPIAAFLEECCDVGSGLLTPTRLAYLTYTRWCDRTGRRAVDQSIFCKDLYAIGMRGSRKQLDEARIPCIVGLAVRQEMIFASAGDNMEIQALLIEREAERSRP